MFARLQDVAACLLELIKHQPEPRLVSLLAGLQKTLASTQPAYLELCQAASWLADLANVLNPDGKPARTGAQLHAEWLACLTQIETQEPLSSRLQDFSAKIAKVSRSYAPGLFHAYNIAGLPRTNNPVECYIRMPVVGCKNYLGHQTQRSGKMGVILYSIVLTCQLHGISPFDFLTRYFHACAVDHAPPQICPPSVPGSNQLHQK